MPKPAPTAATNRPTWNARFAIPGLLFMAGGLYVLISPHLQQPAAQLPSGSFDTTRATGTSGPEVLIFMDTSCVHCRAHLQGPHAAVAAKAAENKLQLSYLPVAVLGAASIEGARAEACAATELKLTVPERQQALVQLSYLTESLLASSKQSALNTDQMRGLGYQAFAENRAAADIQQYEQCVKSPTAAAKTYLAAAQNLFKDAELEGVPAIFINGQRHTGTPDQILRAAGL